MKTLASRLAAIALPTALGIAIVACTAPRATTGVAQPPPTPPESYDRAKKSLAVGDIYAAREAVQKAMVTAPDSQDVKLLAARVRLARLDYGEVTPLLSGIETTEARGLRGRAHWYAGELDAAADDLERLQLDPAANDEWAASIARLARSGAGRTPFAMSGAMTAVLPFVLFPGWTHLVVPIEIDGEKALAMVASGNSEVVIDRSTRAEPSWVSMRFGDLEVHDVPVLVEDLSGTSRALGAPIKALIGTNLLRRLNVTVDWQGQGLTVRTTEAPLPGKAMRVSLAYPLGGAMVVQVTVKGGSPTVFPMLLDTMVPLPVALDEVGWKAAGIDVASLQQAPRSSYRMARLAMVSVGAFEVTDVPGFYSSFTDARAATGMDVHGAIGSGMLAALRTTFTEGGRAMWIGERTP